MASLCTPLPQLSPGETGGPKFRHGSACLALRNGDSVKKKKKISFIQLDCMVPCSWLRITFSCNGDGCWSNICDRVSLKPNRGLREVNVHVWVSFTQLQHNSPSTSWSFFDEMPACLPFSLLFRPQQEATIAQLGVFVPICHCLPPFRILRVTEYPLYHYHHHPPPSGCPFGTQSHGFVTLKPTICLWGCFSYSCSLPVFY